MEAFFDFWLERTGWAVIEGPTDRGGTFLVPRWWIWPRRGGGLAGGYGIG